MNFRKSAIFLSAVLIIVILGIVSINYLFTPYSNTISLRIADVKWKTQQTDQNYFIFTITVELWNPNTQIITLSHRNLIPLFEVSVNSTISYKIGTLVTVAPMVVEKTYASGLTNHTIELKTYLVNYSLYQLPDGKYYFKLINTFYDPNHEFNFKFFNAILTRTNSVDKISFDPIPGNWGSVQKNLLF